MKIRFDFKKECYCIDLIRAIIFSGIFLVAEMIVCFCAGGLHIYSLLILPRFALRQASLVIFQMLVHLLAGFTLEIILSSCRGRHQKKVDALTFFVLALILGYMWFPVFCGLNAFFLSFVICTAATVFSFMSFKKIHRICQPAGILVMLLFLWNLYFTTVNFCIFIIN